MAKDNENCAKTHLRRVTGLSILLAIVLIGLKVWALLETGSVAILSILVDSTMDLLASIITFVAVRVAMEPADSDHRFGHGKAEALAALFQAQIIMLLALGIVWKAFQAWSEERPISNPEIGIFVALVTIGATLALVLYQQHVVRMTGSIAVRTDQIHYQSDLALNVAVIIVLILEGYAKMMGVDSLIATAIAAWMVYAAMKSFRDAIDMLMDRNWGQDEHGMIHKIVMGHPQVKDMHELKTRTSGYDRFIQLHLVVDADLSVLNSHMISDEVEQLLKEKYHNAEIIIHIDPEGLLEEDQHSVHYTPLVTK